MLTPVKLTRVHFPGYEAISDIHDIAAAVIVPKGYRTLATSGHVGVDQYGNLAGTLEEQIRITFEVRSFSCLHLRLDVYRLSVRCAKSEKCRILKNQFSQPLQI